MCSGLNVGKKGTKGHQGLLLDTKPAKGERTGCNQCPREIYQPGQARSLAFLGQLHLTDSLSTGLASLPIPLPDSGRVGGLQITSITRRSWDLDKGAENSVFYSKDLELPAVARLPPKHTCRVTQCLTVSGEG